VRSGGPADPSAQSEQVIELKERPELRRSALMAGIAVTAMLAVAACGGGGGSDSGGNQGGGGSGKDDGTLTVWTTEDVAERVTAQQKIMDAWSAKSGTKVKLVAVAEDQLTTVLTSAAAANETPDVIGALSLNGMNQLRTDDLVDPDAAKEIVDGLGADTFQKRTLELTSVDGEQIAVPSDGFSNLLFYRKDLFKAAGLPEPKTYADIENAAKKLHKGKMAGIVAATAPSDSFTSQTFEWAALANGCQLVDDSAKVTLNSPQCQEAFNFYANLIKETSVLPARRARGSAQRCAADLSAVQEGSGVACQEHWHPHADAGS
jgi:multiple sugar transport system substrate-binding protein